MIPSNKTAVAVSYHGMKNLGLCVLTALALADVGQSTAAEAPTDPSRSLAAPVSAFNAQSAQDPIGRLQAPLTEEELVAAIRSEVSHRRARDPRDEKVAALVKIAETRQLADGWKISADRVLLSCERFAFEVWSVTLDLRGEQGYVYPFRVRERMLRARLIGAEERRIIEKWQRAGAGSQGRENCHLERQAAAQEDRTYLSDVAVRSTGGQARQPPSTAAEVLAAHGFMAPQTIVDAEGVTWVVAHKSGSPSAVTVAIVEMRPGGSVFINAVGYAHVGSDWALLGRLFMEPLRQVTAEMEEQIKAKLESV